MNHSEAYELIDAYVLGTLDSEEHAAVESHLDSGCEDCLARLREVGELSVKLAAALPLAEPSPGIKKRLLARVGGAASHPDSSAEKKSITWWPSMLGLAASVVFLLWAVSLNSDLQSVRGELEQSQQRIARLLQDDSVQHDAALLLGMPCTRLVDLAGVNPNPQAFAQLLLHPSQNFAVAYVYRMPVAPPDHEYQLWYELNGKPQSVGLFTVAPDGSAILKLESLPEAAAITSFQVTIEPRGGLPKPQGMQYLVGQNDLFGTN